MCEWCKQTVGAGGVLVRPQSWCYFDLAVLLKFKFFLNVLWMTEVKSAPRSAPFHLKPKCIKYLNPFNWNTYLDIIHIRCGCGSMKHLCVAAPETFFLFSLSLICSIYFFRFKPKRLLVGFKLLNCECHFLVIWEQKSSNQI